MRTLLLACGNSLRRDDGAAAKVLALTGLATDREMRIVHQLTPECAELISHFGRVIFLDADVSCIRPEIRPVSAAISRGPLTHSCTPAEIVALAAGLYNFTGEAVICRIPARDFSAGEELSADGLRAARHTANQLERFL